MIAKQNAAFTSSCKATATSSSAKTEGRRCLADWVKHNWYISQLGSTLHMWTHCLIRTFSLDAFTTSSGMNLETDKNQSQNQRNDHFHMDRTKTGNSAIFHIEIQRKDEAPHGMVKMLMHICLRFVLVILILSVCCASELTRTGTGYVT